MRTGKLTLGGLTIFAALIAFFMSFGSPAQAMPRESSAELTRTYTGSISASNAAVTSLVDAADTLTVKSLSVTSNQAGTLTFTDGTAGNALLHLYVAANVRVDLPNDVLGTIRLTKGNELYVNALSSATISLSMRTGLEH
jgi:hypothetical protein